VGDESGRMQKNCGLCPISLWCVSGAVTLERCAACTQVLGVVPGVVDSELHDVGVKVDQDERIIRFDLSKVDAEIRHLVATKRCDVMDKYEPIVLMSEIPKECWDKFKTSPLRYTYCQRCCAKRSRWSQYIGSVPECISCARGGRMPLGQTSVRPY
jgi:hypothetical protein